jgi:hypothetical protein
MLMFAFDGAIEATFTGSRRLRKRIASCPTWADSAIAVDICVLVMMIAVNYPLV